MLGHQLFQIFETLFQGVYLCGLFLDLAAIRAARFNCLAPYLRITFSEGVSASKKAGRLKIRSAYFITGAAWRGSEMP